MASPTATFLSAFQTMDSSNRDWERIALAQQQQARQFAQQAVENKKKAQADDFNQMLAMLKRGDDNSQFEQQNRRLWANQNANDFYSGYNAQTSRENAVTSRYNQQIDARRLMESQQLNDDPLGMLGGTPGATPAPPPLPEIPNIPDSTQGGPLFNFAGRDYGPNWGPTTATVFGGGNDPADNGISAFGGPTGAGGREGVAIPAKVLRQTVGGNKSDWERAGAEITLADGTKTVLPVADLGTAEHIWERNQGPTLDLTPGAVGSLGGTVIQNRNGQQAGLQLPSPIANVRVVPDYRQAAAGPVAPTPPDLSAQEPEIGFAPASAAVVRSAQFPGPIAPTTADGQPLLPPPSEGPQSFSGIDLTDGMSQQMTQLRRAAETLKIQELQAKQQAQLIQRYVPRIKNPAAKSAYQEEANRLNAISQQSGTQAAEADALKDKMDRDAKAVEKRQDQVAALSVLDGVLPDAEVRGLIAEASNPTTLGAADQKIKVLQEYNNVRDQHGLSYVSRGMVTAQDVARAGKQLETAEAKKAMNSFDQYQVYKAEAADPNLDEKTKAKFRLKLSELTPGYERWRDLKSNFDRAVKMDARPVPYIQEGDAGVSPDAVAAGPPADDLKARADALREQRKAGPIEEQQKWSQAKDALRNFMGGDEGIVSKMADYDKIDSLNQMKKFIRAQIQADAEAKVGDSAYVSSNEVDPSVVGISEFPRNANYVSDVANALAEDLWTKKMGRPANSTAAPESPGMSADDRKLLEAAKAKVK